MNRPHDPPLWLIATISALLTAALQPLAAQPAPPPTAETEAVSRFVADDRAAAAPPRPAATACPPRQPAPRGGGKNAKHASQRRRSSARQRYEEAHARHATLHRRPNKTPADKRALRACRRQLAHWKRKADDTGENHSQRHKGAAAPRRSAGPK